MAVFFGALVLAGWLLHWPLLRELGGGVTMKTNTSLAVLMAGIALLLLLPHEIPANRRWIARIAAGLAGLLGVLTLIQHLGGCDLGVDQLLASEPPGALGVTSPNRMDPPASLAFALLGPALLLLSRPGRRRWCQPLAFAVVAIGCLPTIGYLYGADELYGAAGYAGIAWPTAVSIVALGLGVLLARHDQGLMALVTADDPGGIVIRRLLLPLLLLPVAVGWLAVHGQRLGWWDAELGSSLRTIAIMLAVVSLLYYGSYGISRAHQELRRQKELLAVTLASIGDGVIVTDTHGRVTFLNGEAERLTGWKSGEAAGQPLPQIFKIINESTRQPVESPADKVLRLGTVVGLANHTILLARDGRETPIDDSGAPVRDARGEVHGVVLVFRDFSQQKMAQEIIRRSEQRYRAFVDASAQIVWRVDAGAQVDMEIPAWQEFTGQTAQEARGLGWMNAIRAEDRERVSEAWRQAIESRGLYEVEYLLRTHDGKWRNILARGVPVKDDHGQVREYIGTCIDITQRKQAEESLRQQKELLAVTLASIGDGVIVTDTHGCVTFLNPEAKRLTGWSDKEAHGRPLPQVFRIINEDTRQQVESPAEKVLRLGTVVGLANHTLLINKDGKETPIDDSGAPVRDASGNVHGVVLVFRDFTEQKAAEANLLHLNRTLRALSASDQAMMHATDEQQYLREVCRIVVEDCAHAMVWVGLADHDAAKSVRPVAYSGFESGYLETLQLTWADTERGRGPTGTAIRTGQPVICHNMLTDPEFTPWRQQAIKRGYASSIALPLISDGNAIGALTIYSRHADPFTADEVNLLTELANDLVYGIGAIRLRQAHALAQRNAEEANQAKDQFIAALSHELRTPLTPALAAAHSVLKDHRLPSDLREDLEMIHRNVALEVTLISDLLDLTRIAAGKLVLDLRPVDAAQVIRDAARICSVDLDGRSQILTIDTPGEPYPMEADAARLNQVFWNLIKNAIKFTPQGGKINITAWAQDQMLRVQVRDTGVGIEAHVLPRLFDRFQQGGEAVTRQFGGLGLGLAIAKAVVEAHGGRISAHSDGRNMGATFVVELPLAPQLLSRLPIGLPQSHPLVESTPGSSVSRPLKILLVEDHADTAKLLSRLLAAKGHSISKADCVMGALEKLKEDRFDLMISDLGLPDGSGLDLMQRVVSSGISITAIALSGYGMEEDIRRSKAAGFTEHLTKPVDLGLLLQAIERSCCAGRRDTPIAGKPAN